MRNNAVKRMAESKRREVQRCKKLRKAEKKLKKEGKQDESKQAAWV